MLHIVAGRAVDGKLSNSRPHFELKSPCPPHKPRTKCPTVLDRRVVQRQPQATPRRLLLVDPSDDPCSHSEAASCTPTPASARHTRVIPSSDAAPAVPEPVERDSSSMALTPRCAQCLETMPAMQPARPRQVCIPETGSLTRWRSAFERQAGACRLDEASTRAAGGQATDHGTARLAHTLDVLARAAWTKPISLPGADRTSIRTGSDVRCWIRCLAPSSSLLLEWTSRLLASVLPPSPRRSHLFAFCPLPLASPVFHFFRHRFCLFRGRSQHSLFRCALLPFFASLPPSPASQATRLDRAELVFLPNPCQHRFALPTRPSLPL